jgi:hypothetical protein
MNTTTQSPLPTKFSELPDRAVFKWKYPPVHPCDRMDGPMVKTGVATFGLLPDGGRADLATPEHFLDLAGIANEVISLSHYPQGEE